MTIKQRSANGGTPASAKENDSATDLARRKLLLGVAWAAPMMLTVVSVKAYGAKATNPGGCGEDEAAAGLC